MGEKQSDYQPYRNQQGEPENNDLVTNPQGIPEPYVPHSWREEWPHETTFTEGGKNEATK